MGTDERYQLTVVKDGLKVLTVREGEGRLSGKVMVDCRERRMNIITSSFFAIRHKNSEIKCSKLLLKQAQTFLFSSTNCITILCWDHVTVLTW